MNLRHIVDPTSHDLHVALTMSETEIQHLYLNIQEVVAERLAAALVRELAPPAREHISIDWRRIEKAIEDSIISAASRAYIPQGGHDEDSPTPARQTSPTTFYPTRQHRS